MGRSRCCSMRLLSERTDYERCRFAQKQFEAEREEHRRINGRESLPLWHLRSHPRSHQNRWTTTEVTEAQHVSRDHFRERYTSEPTDFSARLYNCRGRAVGL